MKANIEKIKELQKQEISLIQKEGTYVQCSRPECGLWRLGTEYHDPATVPDNWTCSMNPDPEARICGLGGDKVEEDEGSDDGATPQGDEGVHQGWQPAAVHSSTTFPHL